MTSTSPELARRSLTAQLQAMPPVAAFNDWCDRHPVLQWAPKILLLVLAVQWLPLTVTLLLVIALVDEARGFGWRGALLGYSKEEFELRRASTHHSVPAARSDVG